jgi:ceramide glucosyltransferase
MTILATVFLALSLLNLVLIAWQWWVASQFPLHRRATNLDQSPAVTLLKPLKGSDPETVECLRSWFTQNYSGPVQILFGVASADDPVCAVLRELITAQPGCEAQLVVCGEPRWPNAKVATLMQLQKIARHEILIVSDADVRVPPDLIEQMVVHFREADVEAQRESLRRVGVQALACATGERGARDKLKLELQSRAPVGLVSCFYRFANPTNFAMRWEAFATNADFWSQVLQAQSLKPLDFALGAVMADSKRWPITWRTITNWATKSRVRARASICRQWWWTAIRRR